MIPTTLFVDRERDFWKGDAEFYRENLTDDALMVFEEPVGTLTRELSIKAVATAPRWAEVQFEDVRCIELDEHAVILTYSVQAERQGELPYRALASSVYVQSGGGWRLAFHQQTPSRRGDAGG